MNTNYIRGNEMSREWINPRLYYLKKIIHPIPDTCPECNQTLDTEDDMIYCTHCGLIVSMSIEYVAGKRIDLPYGRH